MTAKTTKLVAIQLVSTPDIDQNLATITEQLKLLRAKNPDDELLVVLPECCLIFAATESAVDAKAERRGQGKMQQALSAMAQEFKLYLVAGTIPLKAYDGRNYAASLLIAPSGEVLGQYNKIHLFDVDVSDGVGRYRESDGTHPGNDICVIDTPIGRIGLAVCYDLRFSGLFRALNDLKADIIVLPSAFTKETGAAHWEVLLRARAIESQCYMIGSNQGGAHPNGRETWGQSMIVNPWGIIGDQIATGVGYAISEFDNELTLGLRSKMPMASQQRFAVGQLSNQTGIK